MSKASFVRKLAELEAAAAERPRLAPEQVQEAERSAAEFCDAVEQAYECVVSEEDRERIRLATLKNYGDPMLPSYDERLLDIYGPDAQKPVPPIHLGDNGN